MSSCRITTCISGDIAMLHLMLSQLDGCSARQLERLLLEMIGIRSASTTLAVCVSDAADARTCTEINTSSDSYVQKTEDLLLWSQSSL